MAADLRIGEGLVADPDVVLGYLSSRSATTTLSIGPGARLRSGTVVYAGSEIGSGFETGHHVIVREDTRIGDDVSIWSNAVIDYGCVVASRVKIHCNCYVAQFTELEEDVFLAPGVTIANDLFPGDPYSARAMAGPRIQAGAKIGINVTILPYVNIGAGAIIGAGSVVTRDIPAGMVAYGAPASAVHRVKDVPDLEARVSAAYRARMATSRPSATVAQQQ